MPPLAPHRQYPARIADLHPPERPTRVGVYVGARLLVFETEPGRLAGLGPRQLVTLTVGGRGALVDIAPLPGAAATPEPGPDALRWRDAPGGPPRMTLLAERHRIVQGIRAWFDAQGFLEVDTPALVRAPSPEAVFDPVPAGRDWLITSPEFQLKRLLVGGFERVYRLGPVFRGGEVGPHHNPEFTLLEWYRAHEGLEAMAADLEGLLGALAPHAERSAALWSDPGLTAAPACGRCSRSTWGWSWPA
jgi:hypothetical protein